MPRVPEGSPLEKLLANVSDTPLGRYVRYDWKQSIPPDDVNDSVYIQLRMKIDNEGHPRLPECYQEALETARKIISAEIERLESLR